MRRSTLFRAACVVVLLLGVALVMKSSGAAAPSESREALWKKVDEAVSKGLPKTAIEALQPIIDSALKDKAYPEAIKAIAKRIALEGQIQGNKPEERLTRLAAEIAKASQRWDKLEMVP